MQRVRALFILAPLIAMLALAGIAYAQSISNYDNVFRVDVENDTGAELCDSAVLVPVNASNLVDGGYLATSGLDALVVAQANNLERDVLRQMDGNGAAWWYPVLGCLANQESTRFFTYTGGNTTAADNPQSMWLQGASEGIDVPDADSLDITEDLVVESLGTYIASTSSDVTCLPCKDGAYALQVQGTTLIAKAQPASELVQSASANADNVTLDATPTDDNTLIGFFGRNNSSTPPGTPTDWTSIAAASTASDSLRIAYRVVDGDSATVTSTSAQWVQVLEYAGIGDLASFATNTTAAAASLNTGKATPASDGDSLAVAVAFLEANRVFGDWTNDFETVATTGNSPSAQFLESASLVLLNTASVDTTASWTGGNAAAMVGLLVFDIDEVIATDTIEADTEYDIRMEVTGGALTLYVDDEAVSAATFTDDIAVNSNTLTIDGFTGYVSRTRVGTLPDVALSFDGVDDVVTVGASPSLANVWDGGGTLSLTANIESDGENNAGAIANKGGSGNTSWALQTVSESGVSVALRFFQGFSGNNGLWVTDVDVPLNEDVAIQLSYNASSTANDPTITVNDTTYTVGDGLTESSTPSGTRDNDTTEDLQFGNNQSGAFAFDGSLIGPITLQDSGGTVGLWPVDEGSGSTLTDDSGNGNDGTISGATWVGSATNTYALDLTYEPTTVSESQAPTSANSWVATGTVDNQATATPDGVYTFVRPYIASVTIDVGPLEPTNPSVAPSGSEGFPTFVTDTPGDPFALGSFVVGDWRFPFDVLFTVIEEEASLLNYFFKLVVTVAFSIGGLLLGMAMGRGMPGVMILTAAGGISLGAWFSGVELIIIFIVWVVALAMLKLVPNAFTERSA